MRTCYQFVFTPPQMLQQAEPKVHVDDAQGPRCRH